MGVEVVEGADLFVEDDVVYMRTTAGPRRVDVLYRRIDDEYLDPRVFRPDSMLGVPGIFAAYRAGNVTLANAPGAGIADDKAIYPYVPEMIRFYLGEEPMLQNVPTYLCEREDDRAYVLENIGKLVVKLARGLRRLRHAGRAAQHQGASGRISPRRIRARPHDYIAQPTLALSTVPTLTEQGIAPAPRGPAALVLIGQGGAHRARRADPGRAAGGLAGGELIAGRRHEGHLGARGRALTRPGPVPVPVAGLTPMLSRTADSLFWLGRYTERAGNIARGMQVALRMAGLAGSLGGDA